MSSIQNVSFQGRERDDRRTNLLFAVSSPLIVAGEIAAAPLIDKDLRKDSFIKTAKESAKSFSQDAKSLAAGFCKYILRNEELAKKVFDIKTNNKILFATTVVVDTLATFGVLKLGHKIGSMFRND